ncbi:MAG: FtsX-like permease family protein, partial [Longimicrobiales bacterium]
THEHLRPRVVRYTELFVGEGGGTAYLVQLVFVMLVLVLSSNVATLMFARTATRENEIVMRYALGGSRRRIIAQFFVEALVLALIATAIGLAFVAWGTGWITRFFWQVTEGQVPFWLGSGLNATTVLYALALAFISALVAGVIPALKTTRARVRVRLRHPGGAGASALRFGGLWSAMTVAQVAFAVIVVPPAIVAVGALADADSVYPGFDGDEYLSARLEMEMERPPADSAESAAFFAQFQAAYEQLRHRLAADPAVSRVTFATQLPGMDHPQPFIEVDSAGRVPTSETEFVQSAVVDVDFFDAFGAQIVAGRNFNNGDRSAGARTVVVNQHFVDQLLGRSAVGQRFRYVNRYAEREATGAPRGLPRERMQEPGDWYEIVGVVNNLGMDTGKDAFWPGAGPGVYHPLVPEAMGAGGAYAVRIAFHVRGDAASYAPKLRAAASAVSPALRLYDVLPLDRPVDAVNQSQQLVARFSSWMTALVAVVALLVSIAGIYSMLSFTVARQTRDIGVRIALGADRRRIITGVFSPAMLRIGAGIVIGAVVWFYVIVGVLEGGDRLELLLATAVVLVLLGLLACGVPVRRALRIEPAEALREGE